MSERRSTVRERVIYSGQASTGARSSRIDCVVRNISSQGANVEFPAVDKMPDDFSISIPKTGRSFLAKIIWWRANRAGLAFHGVPLGTDVRKPSEIEERLRISERKTRLLKQRVRYLMGEG